MKKLRYGFRLLLLSVVLLTTTLVAQEKSSYIRLSGQLGSSSFLYDLEGGSKNSKLGYGFGVNYEYFFTSNWGVSSGLNVSHYSMKGKQNSSIQPHTFHSLGPQVDDDNISGNSRDYELRVRTGTWIESQNTYLLEIPFMALYEFPMAGDLHDWRIYGGMGVKLQIPVQSKYSIEGKGNQLNVSGYYTESNIDFGAPGLPPMDQHGFGTTDTPEKELQWDGKNDLKIGLAGTIELGCLKKVGQDWDIFLGGYLDYGFIDMQKSTSPLFQAPQQYLPSANNAIGRGIEYSGFLNSKMCDNLRPFSVGVKFGVRFKL